MRLLQLAEPEQKSFDEAPEFSTGLHLAKPGGGASGGTRATSEYYAVIGGQVGVPLDRSTFSEPDGNLLTARWLDPSLPVPERVAAFKEWVDQLEPAPELSAVSTAEERAAAFASILGIYRRNLYPWPPCCPDPVYGHLPFRTKTPYDAVYYRWEPLPSSRRIMRQGEPRIAKGTFAAPATETFFCPTGFAAVARFALPMLWPACFRWELQPKAGTDIYCGACVPMYGQSGGGVEVSFVNGAANRCPIADPVFLPPL